MQWSPKCSLSAQAFGKGRVRKQDGIEEKGLERRAWRAPRTTHTRRFLLTSCSGQVTDASYFSGISSTDTLFSFQGRGHQWPQTLQSI